MERVFCSPNLAVLLLMIFAGVSVLSAAEFPVENPKARVLILNYDTAFKQWLTSSLVNDFNARNFAVTVDHLSNAASYRAENYDALVLISEVQRFGPLEKTRDFILSNQYSSNIVYYSTYAMFNLPYGSLDKKKIDAITSASFNDNPREAAGVLNSIIERTMNVLLRKKPLEEGK